MSIMAQRMKELRKNAGLSVYAMADIIGVSAATISRYENARIDPHKLSIEKYSNYFKVNPLWLIGATEDKERYDNTAPIKIPIFERIQAGTPITAQKSTIGYTWIHNNADVDCALKMPDDSMINARINAGDIVFIKIQNEVEHGDIIAVNVEGETTIKRMQRIRSLVVLHPENPQYEDKIFKQNRDIRIIGKVKYVRFEV